MIQHYSAAYPSKNPYAPVPRHDKRVNFLFLGGNVQSFAGDCIAAEIANPGREDVRWFTGTDTDAGASKY